MSAHAADAWIHARHGEASRAAKSSGQVEIAGLAFAAIGTAFLVVTMLAASIAPGYDFHRAAISDLGAIPETAALFNGVLVAIGLLNVVGGYLLGRALASRWLPVLSVLGGIGAVGAGLIPINAGGLHSVFALVGFVFFNVEVLVASRRLTGPIRWLGVLAAMVGLAYVGLMVIGDAGNPAVFGAIGHGGSERMIAYPAMLWMIALGGYVMAGAGAGQRGKPSDESRR